LCFWILKNKDLRPKTQDQNEEIPTMPSINWTRLIVGGLVAAIIMFVTDGFFHEKVVNADWQAVYAGLKAATPEPHGTGLAYFAIFELGRGMISLLLYATMRAYFGAGPKTAVLAGIAGWIVFSLTGPVQFIPLGFFSTTLWLIGRRLPSLNIDHCHPRGRGDLQGRNGRGESLNDVL